MSLLEVEAINSFYGQEYEAAPAPEYETAPSDGEPGGEPDQVAGEGSESEGVESQGAESDASDTMVESPESASASASEQERAEGVEGGTGAESNGGAVPEP